MPLALDSMMPLSEVAEKEATGEATSSEAARVATVATELVAASVVKGATVGEIMAVVKIAPDPTAAMMALAVAESSEACQEAVLACLNEEATEEVSVALTVAATLAVTSAPREGMRRPRLPARRAATEVAWAAERS